MVYVFSEILAFYANIYPGMELSLSYIFKKGDLLT